MDFSWVAMALNDFLWIGLTFVLGLVAQKIGLPPLVGFLTAGFILSTQNIVDQGLLKIMSDLGITLLLFTIGLKININNLARPQVWAVTLIHSSVIVVALLAIFSLLIVAGVSVFVDLSWQHALLLAFALSFSSTVFVVKVMEERGEYDALHGRIAIGILVIQDILAVVFLAFTANKVPTIWALALLLLIPCRFLLRRLLNTVGHGELLVLFGFLLAIGGAEVFEIMGVKGDLGALILGALLANHPKSIELVKKMLSFKDLFLLGFFLSVGLYSQPNMDTLLLALLLTPLVLLKSWLFFVLFTRFQLRARTALLSTINLSNFSEFGLIVLAIGVAQQWIHESWLVVMALMISFSFVVSAVLSTFSNELYNSNRKWFKRFQSRERLPFDPVLNIGKAEIAIIGMGTIGTGAYDQLCQLHKKLVVGIDVNVYKVLNHKKTHRHVVLGDPSDADFWDRVKKIHRLKLVVLTLPNFATTLEVVKMMKEMGYKERLVSIAKFPEDIAALEEAGVDMAANIFTEAGAGFASHIMDTEAISGHLNIDQPPEQTTSVT
ncbi:cation:proton antiporter family protein [Marinicella meishanensis]|uniref:cation:proton antiporter family protein n=1 Tax=Marinicella meishanensis TaxID=2873263 RepID=UPI001CBC65A6|nr:cation:proton antiporter family protein [Marinicella sp. NBU2979]